MRRFLARAVAIGMASWLLWILTPTHDTELAMWFGAVMLFLVAGGGYTPTFAAMDTDTTTKGATESAAPPVSLNSHV